jgi:fibronectin type 3 domain-containing protein
VSVNPGATTAGFNVAVAVVSTPQKVTLTASTNGSSQTDVMLLNSSSSSSSDPTSQHEVDLTWDAPATSANSLAGYHIYRSTGDGSGFQLVTSSIEPQTAYVDTTVQSGQSYDYYVKSVDAAGVESVPSNTTTAVVP